MTSPRPVFVLGSPRSGTTVIGNYIGSSSAVLNIGEYRAFFATILILPELLQGFSPPEWDEHRARYLREVQEHAAEFAERMALEAGCFWYCDSSPRNVLVAAQLAALLPEAVFVLTVRHYSGVVQSLARSGWDYAGDTSAAHAEVWARAYEASLELPPGRTITLSYDQLCEEPATTIQGLDQSLESHGFDSTLFDADVLRISHAQSKAGARPTIFGDSGSELVPRPSYDAAEWTLAVQAEVEPVVRPVEEELRRRWPDAYRSPRGHETSGR